MFFFFPVSEMETERVLPISAVTVVEEVLQQQGSRLRDFDFASRKAEEAGLSFLFAWNLMRHTAEWKKR